jgi:hypothetical protein
MTALITSCYLMKPVVFITYERKNLAPPLETFTRMYAAKKQCQQNHATGDDDKAKGNNSKVVSVCQAKEEKTCEIEWCSAKA